MLVKKKNLKDLKNVGKATLRDLDILRIHSIDDLIHQDATQLFEQLEKKQVSAMTHVCGMFLQRLYTRLKQGKQPPGGHGQHREKFYKKQDS